MPEGIFNLEDYLPDDHVGTYDSRTLERLFGDCWNAYYDFVDDETHVCTREIAHVGVHMDANGYQW